MVWVHSVISMLTKLSAFLGHYISIVVEMCGGLSSFC